MPGDRAITPGQLDSAAVPTSEVIRDPLRWDLSLWRPHSNRRVTKNASNCCTSVEVTSRWRWTTVTSRSNRDRSSCSSVLRVRARRHCSVALPASNDLCGVIMINKVCVAGPRTFVQPEKRKTAMMFQDYALWPHLTVRKNIAFPLTSSSRLKEKKDQRVDDLLNRVGIAHLLELLIDRGILVRETTVVT